MAGHVDTSSEKGTTDSGRWIEPSQPVVKLAKPVRSLANSLVELAKPAR